MEVKSIIIGTNEVRILKDNEGDIYLIIDEQLLNATGVSARNFSAGLEHVKMRKSFVVDGRFYLTWLHNDLLEIVNVLVQRFSNSQLKNFILALSLLSDEQSE